MNGIAEFFTDAVAQYRGTPIETMVWIIVGSVATIVVLNFINGWMKLLLKKLEKESDGIKKNRHIKKRKRRR